MEGRECTRLLMGLNASTQHSAQSRSFIQLLITRCCTHPATMPPRNSPSQ